MEVIYVAAGAALGGIGRWMVNRLLFFSFPLFPLATLTVNVISGFLAGIFFSLLLLKQPDNSVIRPLLITGFCGGLSTMSALSLESFHMISQGKFIPGLVNVFSNVALSLLATWAGSSCIR